MTSERTLSSSLRDWARGELDLEPEASINAERSAFLAAVRAADFFPSPAVVEARAAVVAMRGQPGSLSDYPQFVEAFEDQLRDEVEQFAERFFSLPIPDRQRRYAELATLSAKMPRVNFWLAALGPGLAIDPREARSLSPELRQLVVWCCELFVLRPQARALRRHAIWQSALPRLLEWRKVAQELRRQGAIFADLAPDLIDPLGAKPPSRISPQKVIAQASRATSKVTNSDGGSNTWMGIPVGVFVVLGLIIKGFLAASHHDNRSNSSSKTRELSPAQTQSSYAQRPATQPAPSIDPNSVVGRRLTDQAQAAAGDQEASRRATQSHSTLPTASQDPFAASRESMARMEADRARRDQEYNERMAKMQADQARRDQEFKEQMRKTQEDSRRRTDEILQQSRQRYGS